MEMMVRLLPVSKSICGIIPASEKIRSMRERMVELLSIRTNGS